MRRTSLKEVTVFLWGNHESFLFCVMLITTLWMSDLPEHQPNQSVYGDREDSDPSQPGESL